METPSDGYLRTLGCPPDWSYLRLASVDSDPGHPGVGSASGTTLAEILPLPAEKS
jgi:hypothetical protein